MNSLWILFYNFISLTKYLVWGGENCHKEKENTHYLVLIYICTNHILDFQLISISFSPFINSNLIILGADVMV